MRVSTLKRHGFKTTVGVAVAITGLAAGLALWGGPSAPTVDAASAKVPKPAKNVIVMISDGWGYNHIAATDYYGGRKQGYESFPVRLAMSTYEIESVSVSGAAAQDKLLGYDPVLFWNDFAYADAPLATDSASAATAMASGTKTYNGAIGVDISKQDLTLITEAAEKKGKATGVVTSVEFSHATPAGFVAHNTSRNNYAEIANEMILDSATDVIMGCGAPDYDDSGNPLAPGSFNTYKYVGGETTWNDITDDLIVTGADADNDGDDDDWTVIRDRRDFQKMAFGPTPSRVLGIPRVYTTLQQARAGDGKADPYQSPLTRPCLLCRRCREQPSTSWTMTRTASSS